MSILNIDGLDKKEMPIQKIFDGVLGIIKTGIAIADHKGIIVEHNKKLTELLCLREQDLKGVPLKKIIPGLDTKRETITGYYLKDRKISIQVETKKVFCQETDNNMYIYSIFPENQLNEQDFDEKKVSKQSYENILKSIDEGVYVVDTKGNLCFYNPALERLEGYIAEDVLGKHVTELYPLDWETSLLLKAITTGKPILDYYQEYFVNNRHISIICNTVPLFLNGVVSGAASIVRDFSRFKEMVEKNLELQEKLVIKKTKNGSKLDNKNIFFSFDQIIGENKYLKECVNWGKSAAKTDSSVFIYGETGTGKELFAQSIHSASSREKGPFLAINCAAIPEALLEGILFGTTKGAFTGAINRVGMLEQADGGTLFLDEINSMSVTLQAKLLRALEERRIRRLGDRETIPIDVRIISSCNVEPAEATGKGLLRSDLFYRLAVVYLVIPPLRERIDDLGLLAEFFIKQYNDQLRLGVKGLDNEVFRAFQNYHWPGNIRQLKHCIECAMNIVPKGTREICMEHLPKYLDIFTKENEKTVKVNNTKERIKENNETIFCEIENSEKDEIIIALKRNKGNISRAAHELGISRQCLQYRLKKYNFK
ncbi:MAG: sigma 54-interacting transcriptional regulator [Dehalobacterium sp.]